MAQPIIHHRTPEYRAIASRVNGNLKTLFQTSRPVLTLTCSGTGGVESTFVSLFSPGEKIVTVNGGKFGERWVELPRAMGLEVVDVAVEWGKPFSTGELSGVLTAHPDAKGVYITQSETSTGTAFDVRALAATVRQSSGALVCVDAISALGAHELRFDEWGIDVCVTGSQKGLMIPPGLAFVALSERAEDKIRHSTMPRFYFDLRRALDAYPGDDTPWTPAVSLVIAADEALGNIMAEGIENVWNRHLILSSACRAGVTAMGLTLYSQSPAVSVTAVNLPPGVDWKPFNRRLVDRYGIVVAGGQGPAAGKIFRIAHLGYYDELDMVTVMAALERALTESGYRVEPGTGVGAVQEVYAEGRGTKNQ
jgi:aspartate aminotransferase-like enzyme